MQRLSNASRPPQVQEWTGYRSRAKTGIPTLSIDTFSVDVTQWWHSLQPTWWVTNAKGCDPFSFSRDIPEGETWKGLKKGDSAGLYVIVMCLTWWYKSLQDDERPSTLLQSLVCNTAFILGELQRAPPGVSAKDDAKERPAKQYVFLLLNMPIISLIGFSRQIPRN